MIEGWWTFGFLGFGGVDVAGAVLSSIAISWMSSVLLLGGMAWPYQRWWLNYFWSSCIFSDEFSVCRTLRSRHSDNNCTSLPTFLASWWKSPIQGALDGHPCACWLWLDEPEKKPVINVKLHSTDGKYWYHWSPDTRGYPHGRVPLVHASHSPKLNIVEMAKGLQYLIHPVGW